MAWLDCRDLDSTLASLADAIGTTASTLEEELRNYDDSRFAGASEDPWLLMPREILQSLGTDVSTVVERLDGAYYFHGTRAIDPETFRRRGILPLDQMVDEVWSTLRALVRDEISNQDWAAFRRAVEADAGAHDGFLYRLKTGDRMHFGPFGLVVRETFFEPQATTSHDYLGCPEIVQDVARCFSAAHGIDLERRFCEASRPSIVKFRSTQLRPGAVNAALCYAYSKLRDNEIGSNSNYSFDGEGEPVPPEAIVEVEIVSNA
jgi:hypothetical protein